MLNYTQRRDRCFNNFWMRDWWTVVIKCTECGRHAERQFSHVIGPDGKLQHMKCESCRTFTCAPVLKDHKTLAVIAD